MYIRRKKHGRMSRTGSRLRAPVMYSSFHESVAPTLIPFLFVAGLATVAEAARSADIDEFQKHQYPRIFTI
jgi:hypothetical protein